MSSSTRAEEERLVRSRQTQDDEPEDDDDDEVEEVAAVVGSGLVVAGVVYWVGGIAAFSTLGLCCRRALMTRGRSLTRAGKAKVDRELPL